MAGYSGALLADKLGIEHGSTALVINGPGEFLSWLAPLPEGTRVGSRYRKAELVFVFSTTPKEMRSGVGRAIRVIPKDGAIWLCWPKKASGIASDLQFRDTVMDYMFPLGLVDVKVVAISDVWSGFKFVIRKELR
ncbi:MAG: hypothetical protein BMS9Abin12_0900 [Acidimicrobiia bacterium]|nr:MAG: hypothetical protein BMS9Abin12_0900 [Acidimicrobiia bacterium]